MNSAPDDILRLVFKAFVELRCSPASLLVVNRQWNMVLLSERSIWSRVLINITSMKMIPSITHIPPEVGSGTGVWRRTESLLRSYLKRSRSLDGTAGTLLDIEITLARTGGYQTDDYTQGRLDIWRLGDQISELIAHLSRLEYVVEGHKSIYGLAKATRTIDETRRWRSLTLDGTSPQILKQFPLHVSFGALSRLCGKSIPSLTSITTREVTLRMYGIPFPNLTHLNICSGTFISLPDPRPVESLVLLNYNPDRFAQQAPIPWAGFDNLQILKISGEGFDPNFPPSPDLFPRLSTIAFTGAMNLANLVQLAHRFNRNRPLKSLELPNQAIRVILAQLEQVPSFHALSLKVSSLYFREFIDDVRRWNWDEYGAVTWPVQGREKEQIGELLVAMNARETRVEAMDMQMEAILEETRRELEMGERV